MLILRAIATLLANVLDYFRTFIKASFDILFLELLEHKRFLKFYLIHLPISAAVLWVMFKFSNQAEVPDNQSVCYPPGLSVIALLILAEVAAFLLFGVAFLEASVLQRWGPASYVARLLQKYPDVPLKDRLAYLSRLIYLPTIAWFPVVLLITVMVSSVPMTDVTEACFSAGGKPEPWYAWVTAAAPGLLVGSAVVIVLNWIVYRWSWTLPIAILIGGSFVGYVVVFVIVGPADVFGLVGLLRRLPHLWPDIAKFFGIFLPAPLTSA